MHCSPFLCLSLSAPPFTGAVPRGHFSLSSPVLQPAALQAGVQRLPGGRGQTALCENPRQASVPGYHTHVPRCPASQGAWPPTSTPCFRSTNPPLICLFCKAQGCSTLLSRQQKPQSLQPWFPRSKPHTCGLFSSRSSGAPSEAQASPGPGVAAELVHVRVVLGQDRDGVALLPDDEPGLLLCGAPQVDAIELGNTKNGLSKEKGGHGGGPGDSERDKGRERRAASRSPQVTGPHTQGQPGERCSPRSPWRRRHHPSPHSRWRCPAALSPSAASHGVAPPRRALEDSQWFRGLRLKGKV